jgi:hypothetical protein
MQQATKNLEAKNFSVPETVQGKDIFALAGGSSRFAETSSILTYGPQEGGSAQDRAADFLEADLSNQPSSVPSESPKEQPEEEGF